MLICWQGSKWLKVKVKSVIKITVYNLKCPKKIESEATVRELLGLCNRNGRQNDRITFGFSGKQNRERIIMAWVLNNFSYNFHLIAAIYYKYISYVCVCVCVGISLYVFPHENSDEQVTRIIHHSHTKYSLSLSFSHSPSLSLPLLFFPSHTQICT